MRIKYGPLCGIPIEIEYKGVKVHGEIVQLYPNDIEVKLVSPQGEPSKGLHVPFFAMFPSRQLAIGEGDMTVQLTNRGRNVAEMLLRELYDSVK